MPVRSRELTAGFRGSLSLNGQNIQGCQSWKIIRHTTITSEGVLDSKVEVPVEQSLTYELTLTELIINDAWSKRVADADANAEQLSWAFTGETRRNDGQITRVVLDDCVISADMDVAGIERGSSRTRDLSFQSSTTPVFSSYIA